MAVLSFSLQGYAAQGPEQMIMGQMGDLSPLLSSTIRVAGRVNKKAKLQFSINALDSRIGKRVQIAQTAAVQTKNPPSFYIHTLAQLNSTPILLAFYLSIHDYNCRETTQNGFSLLIYTNQVERNSLTRLYFWGRHVAGLVHFSIHSKFDERRSSCRACYTLFSEITWAVAECNPSSNSIIAAGERLDRGKSRILIKPSSSPRHCCSLGRSFVEINARHYEEIVISQILGH